MAYRAKQIKTVLTTKEELADMIQKENTRFLASKDYYIKVVVSKMEITTFKKLAFIVL